MFKKLVFGIVGFVLDLAQKFTRPRLSKAKRLEQKKQDDGVAAMHQAVIEEEMQISSLIRNTLLLGLPHHLRGLDTFFQRLPRISKRMMEVMYLPDELRVKEAGEPYSSMLLPYGLKLTDLYQTIIALDRTLERIDELGLNWDMYQGGAFHVHDRRFLSKEFQDAITWEVAMWVHNQADKESLERAAALLDWVMEALRHKPRILPSFIAVVGGQVIQFQKDPEIHNWNVRCRMNQGDIQAN